MALHYHPQKINNVASIHAPLPLKQQNNYFPTAPPTKKNHRVRIRQWGLGILKIDDVGSYNRSEDMNVFFCAIVKQ